jgi:type IV pilus assembly protein PilV
MTTMRRLPAGYILLEVLVTIVILVFGLLGLAGFQMRTSVAEHEAYQRVQALILVQDMTERIYANRANAATYVEDDIGSSGTVRTDCPGLTGKDKDVCEWHNALVGASEVLAGTSVGTLLGGQGCITAGAANEYIVTVVWQGFMPTVTPAAPCGTNDYGNELLRRAVSMRVQISTLSALLPPPPPPLGP